MRTSDVFSAKAIALRHTEVASNKIPYLGLGLFPAKKKASLDLKWINTGKGLPVMLKPSAFDTVSTIRSREGFKKTETEMAYFKESMLLKEADEQEIMRIQDSADPFAQEVIDRIYDDAETLIAGADVVTERMRMSLISSAKDNAGSPKISIAGDGVNYEYNYDPNGEYANDNYLAISTTNDKWDAVSTSDPIADIEKMQDAVEEKTGVRPDLAIVSKKTMGYLVQNAKVRSYILAQNSTANIFINEAVVKNVFRELLGVTLVKYTKQYINENGVATKFFPDNVCALVPSDAPLGNTWFGMTPSERTASQNKAKDFSLVNTGVGVSVTMTTDPEQTKTTVEEICLPSFERMFETAQINCY